MPVIRAATVLSRLSDDISIPHYEIRKLQHYGKIFTSAEPSIHCSTTYIHIRQQEREFVLVLYVAGSWGGKQEGAA